MINDGTNKQRKPKRSLWGPEEVPSLKMDRNWSENRCLCLRLRLCLCLKDEARLKLHHSLSPDDCQPASRPQTGSSILKKKKKERRSSAGPGEAGPISAASGGQGQGGGESGLWTCSEAWRPFQPLFVGTCSAARWTPIPAVRLHLGPFIVSLEVSLRARLQNRTSLDPELTAWHMIESSKDLFDSVRKTSDFHQSPNVQSCFQSSSRESEKATFSFRRSFLSAS